jgi:hypothetical protein
VLLCAYPVIASDCIGVLLDSLPESCTWSPSRSVTPRYNAATPMATASDADLIRFIARQRQLLTREREAEIERTSLLLSNCSHKLLEQKGLALGGLGVVSVEIGLGGKR